jgi:hypothetical protein
MIEFYSQSITHKQSILYMCHLRSFFQANDENGKIFFMT